MRRFIALSILLAAGAILPAHADETVRVRGVIAAVSGGALTVHSREGSDVVVQLKPDGRITGIVAARFEDIKPGDLVGIAALPTEDGGTGAIEVLIFPASLKVREGTFPYDLMPNSTMINARVADAVKAVKDRSLTLALDGRDSMVTLAEDVPVVTMAAADRAALVAGASVVVNASRDGAGVITANNVSVGLNGVKPPM